MNTYHCARHALAAVWLLPLAALGLNGAAALPHIGEEKTVAVTNVAFDAEGRLEVGAWLPAEASRFYDRYVAVQVLTWASRAEAERLGYDCPSTVRTMRMTDFEDASGKMSRLTMPVDLSDALDAGDFAIVVAIDGGGGAGLYWPGDGNPRSPDTQGAWDRTLYVAEIERVGDVVTILDRVTVCGDAPGVFGFRRVEVGGQPLWLVAARANGAAEVAFETSVDLVRWSPVSPDDTCGEARYFRITE